MASSSPPPWSSLPQDVLSEILRWLSVIDGCRFRAVCRSWKDASENVLSLHSGRPQVPWLMAPVRRGTHHAFYDVASPSATFRMTHLPPFRFVAGTSPGGWVLHVDGEGDLHALNILTGEALRPPPLTAFSTFVGVERDARGRIIEYVLRDPWGRHEPFSPPIMESYYYHALIAFPEGGASRGRFVVAVVHGCNKDIAFAWEGDESWTDIDPRGRTGGYLHLIPHDGLIYAVHNNGLVLRFDPNGSTSEILRNSFRYLSGEIRTMCHHHVNYLFELDGDLWMASRQYHYVNNEPPGRRETITTPEVRIYKLDKLARIWHEMKSFGAGLALFLGCNQSLVLSTREFPQLRSGFIYFTDNNNESYGSRPSVRNIGAFDHEKKTFHADYHWCIRLQTYPPPVWILWCLR